jgi:1,2-dihydroxy-3-keto-5-methylthiopentene dioxygenase
MVKIYYHDNADTDQRLPHEGELVPASTLEELGVCATTIPEQAQVDSIALEKGYKNRDQVSPLSHRNYFFEKLHSS